jgi:hypothetical protein
MPFFVKTADERTKKGDYLNFFNFFLAIRPKMCYFLERKFKNNP